METHSTVKRRLQLSMCMNADVMTDSLRFDATEAASYTLLFNFNKMRLPSIFSSWRHSIHSWDEGDGMQTSLKVIVALTGRK